MAALQKLLDYYEHIERLVTKLPKPLQQPILSEIKPVKDIFLRQRPARIAVTGAGDVERLVQSLFGEPVTGARIDGGWSEFISSAGARLQVFDAVSASPDPNPDVWLVASQDGEINADSLVATVGEGSAGIIGLLAVDGAVESAETARATLHGALRGEPRLRERLAATLAACVEVRFRADGSIDPENDRRDGIDHLAQTITRELPLEAKLEMARLSRVKPVQTELADHIVKSISVIAGAIGTQPIPLADFPILTSLQGGMVAAIIYISGRPMSLRVAAEFIAALGANVGLGLALREGTRAALKFVPGFGNAVSGGIAGAGTFAIGRAAMAYFIDRRPMDEARGIFKRKKKALPGPGR